MNGSDPSQPTGGERAFAALFEKYKNLVYKTAYLMLGDADEAVQPVEPPEAAPYPTAPLPEQLPHSYAHRPQTCYLSLSSAIYYMDTEQVLAHGHDRGESMHNLSLAKFRVPASAEEDAPLVTAARHDPAAFAPLYRRYVTPIYRYLYSRLGNVADAEDLTAQVFTEALEGLHHYRERGNFAGWLFTIARHKVSDHYRRQRPHVPLNEALDSPTESVDPLAHVVQEEALRRLAVLVAQLDEKQQELLRLRFAGGLTHGEIGRIVGRSEAAIKMAVHRLLRRLEAEWEESDE